MSAIFLNPPVDVSLTSFTAWTDIDVSGVAGYTPSVVGVLVEVITTGTADRNYGLRKNGSTDSRTTSTWVGLNGKHFVAAIGVDGSGILEGYAENADTDFYLVGFLFSGRASFFTNAVDKSTASTSTWVDMDISGDTGGDTAVGAWVEYTAPAARIAGLRKNGSSDNRVATHFGFHAWLYAGVDASEICEQWINAADVDAYLVGYQIAGATFHTNAIDRSTATTGAYDDLTALPARSIAGIYEVTTSAGNRYNLRANGTSHDRYYSNNTHDWFITACDSNGLVEQKIEAAVVDVYELGYFTAAQFILVRPA